MALTRDTLGRLSAYSDNPIAGVSDAFDTADWTPQTNLALSISTGRLRLTSNHASSSRYATENASAGGVNGYVQMVWAAVSSAIRRMGIVMRAPAASGTSFASMVFGRVAGSGNTAGTNEFGQVQELSGAGAGVQNVTSSPTSSEGNPPRRVHLRVAAGIARLRSTAPEVIVTLPDALAVASGYAGIITSTDGPTSGQTSDVGEWYRTASSVITVQAAMASGWYFRLVGAGAVVLATSAEAAGGVATIDFETAGVNYPEALTLEVRAIGTDALLVPAVTPAERLWGGDVWTWVPEVQDVAASLAIDVTVAGAITVENPPTEYDPCTVLLEVYEADGETVAWEVATDRAHDFPYLLFPSNYGSREIDPVTGAASIATVDVTIADVAQTPGDQSTGFVTERLAGIFGRRCRLRRFISAELGWYVIADGPAGGPRLSETYAGYTFAIRDTREGERRLRAFNRGGTCAIVPVGPVSPFGDDGEGNFLNPGVTPIVGKTLIQFSSSTGAWIGRILFNELYDFTTTPGTTYMPAYLEVSDDGEESLKSIDNGVRRWFPNADILWRIAGSEGPWNVSRPDAPSLFNERLGDTVPAVIEGTTRVARGLNSLLFWHTEDGPPEGFPDEDDVELEVILRHRGPATEDLPYYYEGNLGDLLAKLYTRELERAPDLGGDFYDPQGLDDPPASSFGGGVRFDEAAVAALTTPIVLRATEAVDDGRDWAESHLYAPAGFIPSIDNEGRISPVSRARPSTIDGPEINGAIAEPAPDWNAGERIVTAVRYNYRRYFVPGPLAGIEVGLDGIGVRDVSIEFRDPEAEARHNEHLVEYDASVFGAIAKAATSSIDPGGLPVPGVPEVAAILAADARYEVLERYRNGAPAFRVAVRRADVPTLRDGDYCPAELSWLPDLEAITRGLDVEAVQVLQIEGLDCEWLTLLLEVTPVVAIPGYDFDGEKIDDQPVPGYDFDPDIISDDPSEGS